MWKSSSAIPGLGLCAAMCWFRPSGASAQVGEPVPWQISMHEPVTGVAASTVNFNTALVWLVTGICVLVALLLGYCARRFNEHRNPVPSRTTHHTGIEVAWTVLPVLVLVMMAIPSFRIMREQMIIPEPDVVVQVTGHAWFWSYEWPADQGGFEIVSNMIPEDELQPGQPRLLAVDNELVVPVDRVVLLQVTASDFIHSFGVPSFGIKMDAIPGRLNEIWFRATREGIYYGQCYELCGIGHAYMPIAVRVVAVRRHVIGAVRRHPGLRGVALA